MNKHLTKHLLGLMVAIGGLTAAGAALAQEAEKAESRPVLSLYHIEVKHGQADAWREGVKALKACYTEQKGERAWWAWQRQNGPGTVYTVVTASPNWADFDKQDAQMRVCYPIFGEKMSPHEITVTTQFMRPHADLHQQATGPIARVSGLLLNDSVQFMEVAKAVADTQKAEKMAPREWYDPVGGDSDSEDIMVIRRYANYAEMDADEEGIWPMMTRVHGEEKANALRAQANESIDSSWSYIYEYKADLSYEPAE